MSDVLDRLDDRLENDGKPDVPNRSSFHEFLTKDAKVKVQGGRYVPYSFEGRPVIEHIVERIDLIMGSQKSLCLPNRFELSHPPLSDPSRFMRLLRPIILILFSTVDRLGD
mgnify:CR=1 FL=1